MSHPGAVRVLCSASGDGAAPPGLLILTVSAFPPLILRERGKGVWEEPSLARFRGGTALRQTPLQQKVRTFQAWEKQLQGRCRGRW